MIKLNKNSLNILKREVKKGNIYQLLETKLGGDNKIFTIISKVKGKVITYKDYIIDENYKLDAGCDTFNDWSWNKWNFYMLTLKEARPYLNMLICKNLENEEQNDT
jgi:hypothetical protein